MFLIKNAVILNPIKNHIKTIENGIILKYNNPIKTIEITEKSNDKIDNNLGNFDS